MEVDQNRFKWETWLNYAKAVQFGWSFDVLSFLFFNWFPWLRFSSHQISILWFVLRFQYFWFFRNEWKCCVYVCATNDHVVGVDAIESRINDENGYSSLLLVLIFESKRTTTRKKATFSTFSFSFVAIRCENIGREVLNGNNFDFGKICATAAKML